MPPADRDHRGRPRARARGPGSHVRRRPALPERLATILTRTNDSSAWIATGGFAALVLVAFLFSRTTGLPGFTDYKGVWDDSSGLQSMVVEGLVVLVSCAVLATRNTAIARQWVETRDRSGRAGRPGPAALG